LKTTPIFPFFFLSLTIIKSTDNPESALKDKTMLWRWRISRFIAFKAKRWNTSL